MRRWRCWFGRHDWHQHPDFTFLPVRECRRCLRAERFAPFSGHYIRQERVERREVRR